MGHSDKTGLHVLYYNRHNEGYGEKPWVIVRTFRGIASNDAALVSSFWSQDEAVLYAEAAGVELYACKYYWYPGMRVGDDAFTTYKVTPDCREPWNGQLPETCRCEVAGEHLESRIGGVGPDQVEV